MDSSKEKKLSSTPLITRKPPIKGIESSDHWVFLDEIEAPMWVDLTFEAQFMQQDIDDAWFRISHPVHQMSSGQLKKSSTFGDKNRRLSSEVPDSISRSRGKDYKNRRWIVNEQDPLIRKHPVRKLGGGKPGTVAEKVASHSSSTSMLTVSTSGREPSTSSVDPSKKLVQRNSQIAASTSTSSVVSNPRILRHKSSIGCPRNISHATEASFKTSQIAASSSSSSVVSKPKSLRHKSSIGCPINISHATRASLKVHKKKIDAICSSSTRVNSNKRSSTFEVNSGTQLLQIRKSSKGKCSVGSSSSIGLILENVKSKDVVIADKDRTIKKESGNIETIKKESGSILELHKKHRKDGISFLQHKGEADCLKQADKKSKSKVLGSVISRKPLGSANASRTGKGRVLTQPGQIEGAPDKKLASATNKENVTITELHCPEAVEDRTKIRNGLLDTNKEKPIVMNRGRCSTAATQRTKGKANAKTGRVHLLLKELR